MTAGGLFPDKRFAVYTCLMFWPAIYFLALPSGVGFAFFYFVAFGIPVLAFGASLLFSREGFKTVLGLLVIVGLASVTLLLGERTPVTISSIANAMKYYICPILVFLAGYQFASRADRGAVLHTLVVVFAVHVLFSALYLSGTLQNPIYDPTHPMYTENWVVTSGILTAATGLTLSKFDLAYQVGLVLVGLLLFRRQFRAHRPSYVATIIMGLILLGSTYNKTMMAILGLTLIAMFLRWVFNRSRPLGYVCVASALAGIFWSAIRFMAGQLRLTEEAVFLSPQTLLSRFFIWSDYARFEFSNLFFGYGAGFFDSNSLVIDNQFLYSYLELGAIPATIYFALLATVLYSHSRRSIESALMISFLFCIFVFGDMLSSVMVMYTVGLIFGAGADRSDGMNPGLLRAAGESTEVTR